MTDTPTRESVLAVLTASRKPLSIQQVATALGYHTTVPWAIVRLVDELENGGLVAWERSGAPGLVTFTVHLTDEGLG